MFFYFFSTSLVRTSDPKQRGNMPCEMVMLQLGQCGNQVGIGTFSENNFPMWQHWNFFFQFSVIICHTLKVSLHLCHCCYKLAAKTNSFVYIVMYLLSLCLLLANRDTAFFLQYVLFFVNVGLC